MARIEGIRIQNYRALKDVVLGRTFENQKGEPLPRLMTIIGPNGSGKSSLMDALGFLGDCLRWGVEEACDRPHLDLDNPKSPSLRAFIEGGNRLLTDLESTQG